LGLSYVAPAENRLDTVLHRAGDDVVRGGDDLQLFFDHGAARSALQSSWHFVIRQLEFAVLGVVAMMLLKKTDYHLLRSPGVAFGAIGVAMVLLFAVYFLDSAHHRWLRLGPAGLQPSELAKPALVVFLAFFVTWRGRAINNARYTLIPAACAVGLVIGAGGEARSGHGGGAGLYGRGGVLSWRASNSGTA
jgi:hypothetical protein